MSGPLKLEPFEAFVDADAHPENERLRALRRYWEQKRGAGAMPARRDMNPAELVPHLPSVFLFNVHAPASSAGDFDIRLMGTALDDLFGRSMTGRTVAEAFSADGARITAGLLGAVARFKRPMRMYGEVKLAPQRDEAPIEALFLPLSSDGNTVDMIIGEVLVLRRGMAAGLERVSA